MKILVIRTGALGDVIQATGIVRELYNKHKFVHEVQIDVATDYEVVFKGSPYVHRAAKRDQLNGTYDLVIDLDLAYELNPSVHIAHAYAEKAGLGDVNLRPELYPDDNDRAAVNALNLPAGFIAVHMRNHFWANRNLPADFWIELLGKLVAETDANIVQIGTGTDLYFNGMGDRGVNLVGNLSVHETAVLIERSDCFVGVDAGTLHIASCTNAPIVGLYTAVRGEYREPQGRPAKHINIASNIECYGCVEKCAVPYTHYYCERGDEACVRSFSIKEVFNSILDIAK